MEGCWATREGQEFDIAASFQYLLPKELVEEEEDSLLEAHSTMMLQRKRFGRPHLQGRLLGAALVRSPVTIHNKYNDCSPDNEHLNKLMLKGKRACVFFSLLCV